MAGPLTTRQGPGAPHFPLAPLRQAGEGEGPQAKPGQDPRQAVGTSSGSLFCGQWASAGTTIVWHSGPLSCAPPGLQGGAVFQVGPQSHRAAGPEQDGLVAPPHRSLKALRPVARHQVHDSSLGTEGSASRPIRPAALGATRPPHWVTVQGSSDQGQSPLGTHPSPLTTGGPAEL